MKEVKKTMNWKKRRQIEIEREGKKQWGRGMKKHVKKGGRDGIEMRIEKKLPIKRKKRKKRSTGRQRDGLEKGQ